jgi:ferredoxin-NADP reductase
MAAPNVARFEVSRARGSFTLHQDPQRPGVFLAGGIGITPMHSIIRWASQQAHPHRLFLFYSNRKVEDVAFFENLEELARQNSRFRFVPNDNQFGWTELALRTRPHRRKDADAT